MRGNLANISTAASVLNCLQSRQAGPDAWKYLVDCYGPPIVAWCLGRGLQLADAEDVSQEVLIKLYRRLPDFDYDPDIGFRPYLWRLIHSTWCDCVAHLRRVRVLDLDSPQAEEQEARLDLEQRLNEQFDRELLAEAMVRVAGRVSGHTFEAFRLQTVEGLSAGQVAVRLGMKVASVYKAKSNVQQRLRDEIAALAGDTPEPMSEAGK